MNKINSEKCEKHNQFNIQFACLDINNRNPFQCSVWMLKETGKNQYVYIPEVLNSESDLPIQNWPKGIEQEVLNFLCLNSKQDKNEQIKDNIIQFYKELTSQILYQLEDCQQQTLKELDIYQLSRRSLIEFYIQKFKIDRLKEDFFEQEQFKEQKFQKIQEELEQTKENDLLELTQKVHLLKDIENNTNFGQPQQIKDALSQFVKEINFFPFIDNMNEQHHEFSLKNQQEEWQKIDENNIGDFITQNIMKLIKLVEISKKSKVTKNAKILLRMLMKRTILYQIQLKKIKTQFEFLM